MRLPLDSWACRSCTRPSAICSPRSVLPLIDPWVTLMLTAFSPAHGSGAVDEGVEHLVDGRDEARGRLVGALVLEQVRHLLVDVHPGVGLYFFIGGGDHRVLHLRGVLEALH